MNSHRMERLCENILKVIEEKNKFKKLIHEVVDILLQSAEQAENSNGKVDLEKLTEIIIHGDYSASDKT